jgi:hypothetical protein
MINVFDRGDIKIVSSDDDKISFKDLIFTTDNFLYMSGILMQRARCKFKNGYGASVIIGDHSYGGPDGLYELSVFHGDSICYSSGITEDVIGRLSEEEVEAYLDKIRKLNGGE